jgi:hypothetical protein
MGTRLISGRDLTWPDVHAGAPVALISENFAREVWGSPQAAIGKRIRTAATTQWREITGVTADLRYEGVDRPAPTLVYWPLYYRDLNGSGTIPRSVHFLIRSTRTGQGFGALRADSRLDCPRPPLQGFTKNRLCLETLDGEVRALR